MGREIVTRSKRKTPTKAKESARASTSGKVRKRKKTMIDKDSVVASLDDSVVSLSLEDSEDKAKCSSCVDDSQQSSEGSGNDCSICLQRALHPVKLPCNHIFCYLCIKGVLHNSVGQCALCRAPVPRNYVFNPTVVEEVKSTEDKFVWYYEGRSGGWWEYDARTSQDIEDKHQAGEKELELMIAGYIYIIDLDNMVQKRKTSQNIQRKIKRDKNVPDKKGVAGLKAVQRNT